MARRRVKLCPCFSSTVYCIDPEFVVARTGIICMDVVELIQTYKKRGDTCELDIGTYTMVIGEATRGRGGGMQLLVAKLASLTEDPDRFSMWLCEVVDAQLELARADAS